MSPLTLKKSRASKGSVSKVSLDRRRQERMCSGDALATPHFAQTGKTLSYPLKSYWLPQRGVGVTLGGLGEVHREIFSWQGHPRCEGQTNMPS
ncbi:hypothetical protein AVEN_58491-1 [Araneus ventricosus]|uniref:Uncharacterized protein n=1 Tax=Araneus ventricosus TaxID=182803 RepID=A0A4Y2TRL1_ARAVE|nr:hypothetical protein AVEN_88055-1 [Araneus ventricosus]GBO02886.1 hypothetical protein AVEN_58491-1 [Araneus ventricosus]